MIDILLLYLAISMLFNVSLFVVAFIKQSDKLTDISYALTFLIITISSYFLNQKNIYSTILLVMMILWAARLGGFLLYRVIKVGKDSRFDSMRSSFLKFGQFWLLQGISVWILTVPIVFAMTSDIQNFNYFAVFGLIIYAIGLSIETLADFQKQKFHNDLANKGKWISDGLWKYSRHPNYLGEILVWVGVYLYALPSLNVGLSLIASISPIFISVLLLFVSGIPLLEKSADKKWGNDKKYQDYRRKTSILLLLPNKK